MFWLLVAVASTAVVVHGCRALPSLPRDLHGRHPCMDCMVRNPEGVDCRVNGGSLASSPRCLGN